MISRIALENFRAFSKEEVVLRPISVILGPNNSGKSSLIAPLRLLAQTMESFDHRVPLLLDGPLGDFGTYRDVVHGNDRRRRIKITVGTLRVSGSRRPRRRPQAEDSEAREWTLALKFWYRSGRRELILDEAEVVRDGESMLTVSYSRDTGRHSLTKVGGKELPSNIRVRASREVLLQHFIPRVYPFALTRPGEEHKTELSQEQIEILEDAFDAAFDFLRIFTTIEYVGPMRLPPARIYQNTGETYSRVGAQGENWASILASSASVGSSSKRDNGRSLQRAIDEWLASAGLASDIRLDWMSDRHYEIRVQHPVSREYENLADVGQGNSQILPVLVGGLGTEPGSTFLVEEPEIHLHPHAQAELGDFFLTLYERGVQSLVETHSEYLLLRLQQHVASGAIPHDAIGFYYVQAQKDRKDVSVLELDPQAVFKKPIPGGFFPQKLDEAKKLARIRAG